MAFNKEILIEENRSELNQLLTDRQFIIGLGDMGFFKDKLTDPFINLLINDVDTILTGCKFDRYKYCCLVDTLLYKNHNELALKLDPCAIDMCDLNRCDPKLSFRDKFSFFNDEDHSYEVNVKCDLKWDEKSYSNSLEEVYLTNKSDEQGTIGFCLLINNYFTKGTYKEMQKFRNIFYQLNFDVIMEKNLTAKEIEDKLIKISRDERLKQHSAFVFMIITHGYANRTIVGFDGQPLNIDSLVSIMKNKNCKDLAGQPKLFFFNACRTDERFINLDRGVPVENTIQQLNNFQQLNVSQESTSGQTLVSEEVDNLICFTTMEGYPAFVCRISGTRFGATLSEELIKRAWRQDLEKILKRVLNVLNKPPSGRPTDETIDDMMQNSTDFNQTIREIQRYSFPVFPIESTLPKHVYFNFKEKRSFV